MQRPTWEEFFTQIAEIVALRSNCERRHFGAVIVDEDHKIQATGYNGTPAGTTNCSEGGCPRCNGDTPPGSGYDQCFCVHAEENALLYSDGSLEGCTIYVTGRPCILCLRHIITKKIWRVVYDYEGTVFYEPKLEDRYWQLVREGGLRFEEAHNKGATA